MRVKFGFDPTAADLHLGHLVPLLELRKAQDKGHIVTLIVGDFTAAIGDPTGRSDTRKMLSRDEIDANIKATLTQFWKFLDYSKTEVRRNSAWYRKMELDDFFAIASKVTASKALERTDFKERMATTEPLHVHEILYPILQAYDSVQVQADMELGGTDQLTNLLLGRELMKKFGMKEQEVVTVPLLVGTDGVRKMSKSFGNTINLSEDAVDVFGKTMRISDDTMYQWQEAFGRVRTQNMSNIHPMQAKKELAAFITSLVHGPEETERAHNVFVEKHQSHKKNL